MAAVAVAQPAAQAMKTFASSSDVAALIARAKSERKPDQPTFAQPIVQLAPYNASLEYRALVGPAAVHEKEAELFYVVEGSPSRAAPRGPSPKGTSSSFPKTRHTGLAPSTEPSS